jgi:Rap1a immunity proteins
MRTMIDAIAMLLAIGDTPAHAVDTPAHTVMGFYGGNALYEQCSGNNALQQAACQGYIPGAFFQAMGLLPAKVATCKDRNVTAGQLVDVVKNFLVAHPEQRQYGAADLVTTALTSAFPCQPGEKP